MSGKWWSRTVGTTYPIGYAVTTPAVGASTVNVTNTNGYPVIVTMLTTGTVTNFSVTDPWGTVMTVTTAITKGMQMFLDPGAKIKFTYTVVPTWKWYGL